MSEALARAAVRGATGTDRDDLNRERAVRDAEDRELAGIPHARYCGCDECQLGPHEE